MQSKLNHIIRWAGAICMLLLILLLIIEGTWAVRLYHGWLFVGICILSTFLLFVAGICDVSHRAWAAAFSHLGLALVLSGAMMGAVVETNVHMVVDSHATERVAYDNAGQPIVLPFSLMLEDFHIDFYADGKSPKQYTSTLTLTDNGTPHSGTAAVNHPMRYKGWWIYQNDYDRAQQDFCILQLVHDPCLPVVYLGMIMMLIGAFMLVVRAWHSWKILPAALLLALIFAVASIARISLGTLVPALRSYWFFPHILVYMIAYSLLTIAIIFALVFFFSGKDELVFGKRHHAISNQLPSQLLSTVSALLLIGMIFGAIWAKEAWGSYWTWDAKECWAAVTWMITIVCSHLPQRNRRTGILIALLLTFASMQITWYGVGWLPSAEYSMHTYNQ